MWVLAAAPTPELDTTFDLVPKPDYVVAADGGVALAARLGLVPDLVIGDFDSSDSDQIAQLKDLGVEQSAFDHETKWETDTELAAIAALRWQPKTIIILGAIGGRLDHTLANVLLLAHPGLASVDVRIVDASHEVFLAKPGEWNQVRGRNGDTVTLLPLGGDVDGVQTQGLHWRLDGDTLHTGLGRGVSNYIELAGAQVWVDKGQMLVVVTHR